MFKVEFISPYSSLMLIELKNDAEIMNNDFPKTEEHFR